MSAYLRPILTPIVGEEKAAEVIDVLIKARLMPPLQTLVTRDEVEALPDGTPVLVGLISPHRPLPVFGYKIQHAVLIQGDPEPWPLHDPNAVPPLPCTIIWAPRDTTDFGKHADGTEAAAVLAQLLPPVD